MEEKLVSMKETCKLVSLSRAHITRLEQEEKFPKRIRLTDFPNGRFAYAMSELQAWIAIRVAKRTP